MLEHLHSQGHIDKSEKTSSAQTHTHTQAQNTHKVILNKVANSSKSTTEITVITNILPVAKSFSPEKHINGNLEQMCLFMNITIPQNVSWVNVLHWKARDPITEHLLSSLLMRNGMMKGKTQSIQFECI